MLQFLAELLGGWAEWRLDRLSPRTLRALNAVFVAICGAAAALVLLAVLVLIT